jgi:L-threonylcarbamoyladenylate synthase
MRIRKENLDLAVKLLANGGIIVMPTDTLYGVLGSARNQKTVTRIYRLRRRSPGKPMIILISDPLSARQFGVRITPKLSVTLDKYWPGKVSIILPVVKRSPAFAKFQYLHRGTGNLAFRVPRLVWLRKLLAKTGPLIAPSANPQSLPPAITIRQAKKYFGRNVDLYIDGDKRIAKASKLLRIKNNEIIIIRK